VDALVELAARSSSGIDVRLLWDRRQDALSVHVIDWKTDEVYSITVSPSRALEVFEHPFAYVPAGARTGELVVS
jgi:hypothetical protein